MPLNGCEAPLGEGKVLVTLGQTAFNECPARFVDAYADEIVNLAQEDALASVPPLERLMLPSGLVEAIEYAGGLLAEARDG